MPLKGEWKNILIKTIKFCSPPIVISRAVRESEIALYLCTFEHNNLYYPLLFDHDYPEFNFHTYEYLNKDTQFIVKFLKDEILYFIGDSKILDPDILTEQWIDLEFKEFDSISDIIEFVYNLYNVY